jgi:hypothetical protein
MDSDLDGSVGSTVCYGLRNRKVQSNACAVHGSGYYPVIALRWT